MRVGLLAAVLAAAAVIAGCSEPVTGERQATTPADSAPAIPPESLPISHPTVWMCAPELADNPCEGGLDATVLAPDGTTTVEPFTPAEDPKVDCFYVYPTVTQAEGANAPLEVNPSAVLTARTQAARFASVCRLYAPVYRQLTLGALRDPSIITPEALELPGEDVRSAWHDYLANHNNGRGVILIGHSQGAAQLISLIRDEIDDNPAQRRLLVAAYLLGGNVQVRQGEDAGGDFANVPACRSSDQTGCVVAYSAFSASSPPPENSLFGRANSGPRLLQPGQQPAEGQEVLCVNPAALAGGAAPLRPYLATKSLARGEGSSSLLSSTLDYPTGFVTAENLLSGECRNSGGASWLEIGTTAGAGDSRQLPLQELSPEWGLHLVDVNVALGDLVALAEQQARAWEG